MTGHPARGLNVGLTRLATPGPQASRNHSRRESAAHFLDLAHCRSTGYRYALATSGLSALQEQREAHDPSSVPDAPVDHRLDRKAV